MECIKIVISTKQLARELKQFDFSIDAITKIVGKKDCITLFSDNKCIDIDCTTDVFDSTIEIEQQDRRYDWLLKTMKRISDQPVELWISKYWIR